MIIIWQREGMSALHDTPPAPPYEGGEALMTAESAEWTSGRDRCCLRFSRDFSIGAHRAQKFFLEERHPAASAGAMVPSLCRTARRRHVASRLNQSVRRIPPLRKGGGTGGRFCRPTAPLFAAGPWGYL